MEKKKSISIVLICVLVILGLVIYNQVQAQSRLDDYKKYCETSCELKKVSKVQLEETISKRKQVAINNIDKYQKNINDVTKYLSENKLNDKESSTLSTIKVTANYDSKNDYPVDELIIIESDYRDVSKKLTSLKTEFRVRYLTEKITDNQKSIEKTKKALKNYELTSDEKEVKKKLDQKLTFDSKVEYKVEELSTLNKTYKTVKTEYEELISTVKTRTEQEARQAALANSTSNTINSSNNTTNSNSNNTTNSRSNNTTNSNSNTSNNSSGDACYDSKGRYNSACITSIENNSNTVPANICPYRSEAAAISFANAHVGKEGYTGAYSTTVCDHGTWDIYWF